MVLGIPQDKTFFYKTLLDINKMSQTLSMNYKKKDSTYKLFTVPEK